MAAATHTDLAALLNRQVDSTQGQAVLAIVTSQVSAYTRGVGFVDGVPNDELRGVILLASLRILGNPEQLSRSVVRGPESADWRGGFSGFTVGERMTLDRYRVKAA